MKKTPEELRAMCIAAGIHPNAEGRMPRNVWALATAMNELLGSGEPVAFRVDWSADAPAAMRSFYSADEMAYQRTNVEWLGGTPVPLYTTPPAAVAPTTPPEQSVYQGPKKWLPHEVERGNVGLRWVTADGVCGTPTSHDVLEYLRIRGSDVRCSCNSCEAFYSPLPAAVAPVALTDEQIAHVATAECGWDKVPERFHLVVRAVERAHGIVAQKGGE